MVTDYNGLRLSLKLGRGRLQDAQIQLSAVVQRRNFAAFVAMICYMYLFIFLPRIQFFLCYVL